MQGAFQYKLPQLACSAEPDDQHAANVHGSVVSNHCEQLLAVGIRLFAVLPTGHCHVCLQAHALPLMSDDADVRVAARESADVGPWPPSTSGPDPVPLNHYLQNMISPRSRTEYDEFNRYHFSRLKQGRDKGQVTPKVGGASCMDGYCKVIAWCRHKARQRKATNSKVYYWQHMLTCSQP